MAGKTLIGGTAYEISGGKTRVNGTAYAIAGGKTLVGGTAYDISFGVDLAELFRGMTVLDTNGRNLSSTRPIYINRSVIFKDGVKKCYVFSFCDGYMSISKITDTYDDGVTYLYQSSPSYGNIWDTGVAIYYSNVPNHVPGSNVYGATLAFVTFDQPEAKVDVALQSLNLVANTGRDSTGMDTIILNRSDTINLQVGDFVFVAQNKSFAINVITGHTQESVLWQNLVSYDSSDNPSLLRMYGINLLQLSSQPDQSTSFYGATLHVVRGG